MQEDILLVRQTLSGDEKAYHRLFKKYQKVIYAQILSTVHSPADAEELTNDVFQKAYQNLSSLRQPDKFFFWIVKIAKNHCQNWLQRHKKPFLSLEDVPVGELPSTGSAEEELLRQEKYQKVLEALDTLPDIDRELMKSFYFEDASYDTLQKRHGLSKKAVAMRLVKARRKVREKVEKMLSGIVVFPWRDVMGKLFLGGMQAMKISATTKLVTVWAATLLILSGIIVSVWHTKPPKQAIQKSVATQSAQEMPTKSFGPSFSKPKPFANSVQKPFVSPPVTGSVELLKPSSSELEKSAEILAIEGQDDAEKEEEKDESKLKEEQWKAEVEETWGRLEQKIFEYGDLWQKEQELLSIAKSEYGDVIPAEPYGNRIWEIRRTRRKMHPELMHYAIRYVTLTGQREALESEDGWLKQLFRENGFVLTNRRPGG